MTKPSELSQKDVVSFMLKEYERLSRYVSDEDRETEQRVNYFLTIFTASSGVIAILFQLESITGDVLSIAALVVLIILSMLGLTTQNRLAMRAVHHRAYSKLMKEIQNYFANRNSDIADYINVQRELLKKPSDKSKFSLFFIDRLRGTLTELVALINSLLFGGIAAILLHLNGFPFLNLVILSVTVIVVARILIHYFSQIIKKSIYPFFR